jgi:hypothetical protein
MNPIIPLGAVALALAGFMFWKKGNETAPPYIAPLTPVVPPGFAPPAILPAPLAPYVPPAFVPAPGTDFYPIDPLPYDPDFNLLPVYPTDPHIGKPGYLGNGQWDMLYRPPAQGAIDPDIGKPGYLGRGRWDMLFRDTGASEQAYWSGYPEG